MEKVLLSFIYTMLFLGISIIQAQNSGNQSIEELDSLRRYYTDIKKDYATAILYSKKLLEKTKGIDSLYKQQLINLAKIYTSTQEFAKAKALITEVVNKVKDSKGSNSLDYYLALKQYFSFYKSQQKYDELEPVLKESMEGVKKLKGEKSVEYAVLLDEFGMMTNKQGKLKESLDAHKKAFDIITELGQTHHVSYTDIVSNLAGRYNGFGQYDKAEALLIKLLKLTKAQYGELSKEYGLSLAGLANVQIRLIKSEEVETNYLKVLEIFKATFGKDHPYYSVGLNNLAVHYLNNLRFEESVKLFEEAISLTKEGSLERVQTLGNRATCQFQLGDYANAENSYKEILQILVGNKKQNTEFYALSLNRLALLFTKTQRLEEAIPLYTEALTLLQKIKTKEYIEYTTILNNLAKTYELLGDYSKAIPAFSEVIATNKKIIGNKHPNYFSNLNNLASLYIKKGDSSEAKHYLNQAIFENCTMQDSSMVIDFRKLPEYTYYSDAHIMETLEKYAEFFRKQHGMTNDKAYLHQAYIASEAAIKINEKIRNKFSNEESKLRMLKKTNNLVKNTIKTGVDLDDKTLIPSLLSYAELNKSILLADAIKSNRARMMGDLPDTLVQKEIELKEALEKLKSQETDIKVDKEKLLADRNGLNIKIGLFKKQIEEQYPKYYKLKYAEITATASDIQKLLDDKTCFLEYFISDSTLYLFNITKTEVKLHQIALNNELMNQKIKDLRKALSDYTFIIESPKEAFTQYTSTAYWFYQTLLKDYIENPEKTQYLIIVTDGELGHLPFEAFLTEKSDLPDYKNLPYLLHKYKISYNYSATLWKENKENPAKKNSGLMLAAAASYKEVKDSSFLNANLTPHLRNLRKALQDLPAAKEEVAGLSKVLKGKFWQEEATNEKDFKAQAEEYAIIHLAMHGLLNRRAPILSSLAFTENGDSTEDNFLEAWEIAHLKLNADLVVLSACETGYGKFQQGEGVMSLARSFMYAGVPSLVVSMWQVNDASTSLIMQSFYKNLAGGMDKAEALRQAKLEYIGSADDFAAHPAFWAPFVQLGDSRPIHVERIHEFFLHGQGWWWIGGGLLAVVAVGGGAMAMRRRRKES